jgi:hypothetical protein
MPNEKVTFNRRELLKVMTALGGSLAASSMVPSQWTKPSLEAGVLPAHAQSTLPCLPPYKIVQCDLQPGEPSNQASFFLVSHAQISAPCPGIELMVEVKPSLVDIPELKAPKGLIFKTNADGIATAEFLLEIRITAPEQEIFVHVVWSFFNTGDGSGTCETNEVQLTLNDV